MRRTILPTVIACSLACATAWPQGALAAAASTSAASGAEATESVPDPDEERVGRVFVEADGLGEAGPVLAGRSTKVAEEALTAESVTLTDAPAGPELRITLSFRDAGGYQASYEIVYDNEVIEDGTGGFECQLCTEDELIEKVEALAKQVSPKLVVPKEPEPEGEGGGGIEPNGGGGESNTTQPPDDGEVDPPSKGLRAGGIALVVTGGLVAVGGVVLLVLPPSEVDEPSGDQQVVNTRPLGGLALGGGLVLAAVGATMWGIYAKRKKDSGAKEKSVVVVPWLDRGAAGVGVTGRF